MARRRVGRRTASLKRSATAFAPGQGRSGRTISWENLMNHPDPELLSVHFPTVVRTTGNFTERFVTLIPVLVTGSVITLERIRGSIDLIFDSSELATNFNTWSVTMSIQLVPIRDGAIDEPSILSPTNAGDLESNRFLWVRTYYPDTGLTITGPGALEQHTATWKPGLVDVKSRRRFDRSLWALIGTAECETGAITKHRNSGMLRALFRTYSGV